MRQRLSAVLLVWCGSLACSGSGSSGSPNRPPVAAGASYASREGRSVAIVLAGSDLDGDPLTFRIDTPPAHGQLIGAPPSIAYRSEPGYSGEDAFSFVANDGHTDSPPAIVAVTVAADRAPVASAASVQTTVGSAVAMTLSASDADGDALELAIASPPGHGTLSGSPPAITYVPEDGFVGSDAFSFTATDGVRASSPAIVTIDVFTSPVAHADAATTWSDVPVLVRVLDNDSDPAGFPLSVAAATQGAHGTVSVKPDGELLYAPEPGFQGIDSFEYTLGNGGPATAAAGVTVRVQGGGVLWARRAGGAGQDEATAVTALPDGSFVVTGYFAGTSTFGAGEEHETTLASAGGRDLFVARFAADGSLGWARRAGGTFDDLALAVGALPDGSTVVGGQFTTSATFGEGEPNETTLTAPANDMFLASYGADGHLLWVRQANSAGAFARGVATLDDGSIVVTGYFRSVAVFGQGEPNETTLSAGQGDLFVARYAGDGSLEWVKQAGGDNLTAGSAIAATGDGSSVVVAGYFAFTTVFGAGESHETTLTATPGHYDTFVARFAPDGRLLWAEDGGLCYGCDASIAALGSGGALLTTSDWATLSSYDADGVRGWTRAVPATSAGGRCVAAADDGSSLWVGAFQGAARFGAGEAAETSLSSRGDLDAFAARLSPDGALLWASSAGGVQADGATGAALLTDGGSVVVGKFSGTATFGTGQPTETSLVSAGATDVFLVRLRP